MNPLVVILALAAAIAFGLVWSIGSILYVTRKD